MEQVLQTIINIPTIVYVYILGGLGVTVVTQVSKKLLALESDKKVVLLLTGVSFVFSGIEYLATSSGLPPTILGVNTATLIGIAIPLYHFGVKPINEFITAVKLYRLQLETKATEISLGGQPLPQPTVITTESIAPPVTSDKVTPEQLVATETAPPAVADF